jgi:6-phosphogluconolactonase (cycloisomerase 2 family)
MKIGKFARLLLAVPPFLAGCGNFWQPPSGSTGTGTTTTTLSSGNFYVLNLATRQIVGYNINSGSLNQIGAYTLSSAPNAIAIAPSGKFLYVSTVTGIYLYTIASNGALTIGYSGNVVSSDPAAAIAVDTTGGWLLDAIEGTSGFTLAANPISSDGLITGAAVAKSYGINNAAVHQMAISGDDANIFVTLGTVGTAVISFNSSNAEPLANSASTIAVANTGGSALSVAVDPSTSPRLFYIGETLGDSAGTSGGLRVFNYSSLGASGGLTQASGSPIASGGLAPNTILAIASGDYVYAGNGTGPTSAGNITGFSVTSSGGIYTVATGSTVAAGTQPYGLAEDSDSHFVLAVAEGGNSDLTAYIFDTTTAGQLDVSLTSTTGTDPTEAVAVAAAP